MILRSKKKKEPGTLTRGVLRKTICSSSFSFFLYAHCGFVAPRPLFASFPSNFHKPPFFSSSFLKKKKVIEGNTMRTKGEN